MVNFFIKKKIMCTLLRNLFKYPVSHKVHVMKLPTKNNVSRHVIIAGPACHSLMLQTLFSCLPIN